MIQKKVFFDDINYIRIFLIFLLVFYHAFAPFCGSWDSIYTDQNIPIYWWLGKLSYSFMLPMFVSVSGYVLGYQANRGGYGRNFISKKLHRLLLPSIIFSSLYFLCFYNIQEYAWYIIIYKLINGVGHMWFLPMLFWCFLFCYILDKIVVSQRIKLISVFLLSIFPIPTLPFQLAASCHYMIYFYIAYLLKRNKASELEIDFKVQDILMWSVLFICLFIGTTLIERTLISPVELLSKCVYLSFTKFLSIVRVIPGIILTYIIINYLLSRDYLPLSTFIRRLGNLCFGVYLLQQFILMWLYYNTDLPLLLSPITLPWAGFIIALTMSLALTVLMKKTLLQKII